MSRPAVPGAVPAVLGAAPAVLGGAPAFPDGLPLVRPSLPDVPALARRIEAVLDSGMLTNGRTVRELEETAATYLGVGHVVAVASCTTGLLLVLQATGVSGRVVLPSFTFAATAHVVHWVGATPSFADVHARTLTLDPADAAARLDGAEAMVATHLYGTPAHVEALEELATSTGALLVYDAAHALGSRRRGRPVGGFGNAEVFSLSPTKVVVAGEGGLVATDDGALAEACRIGRDYGNPGDYDCLFPGLNARMSELHAAVAIASLRGLDDRVARRGELVARFRRGVEGLPGIGFPEVEAGDTSTFKDMALLVDPGALGLKVPQLAASLRAEGVDSRRYYWPPVHRQKAYAHLPAPDPPLPVTDRVAERVLCPPLWSHMTDEQIDRLAGAVGRICEHAPAVRVALG